MNLQLNTSDVFGYKFNKPTQERKYLKGMRSFNIVASIPVIGIIGGIVKAVLFYGGSGHNKNYDKAFNSRVIAECCSLGFFLAIADIVVTVSRLFKTETKAKDKNISRDVYHTQKGYDKDPIKPIALDYNSLDFGGKHPIQVKNIDVDPDLPVETLQQPVYISYNKAAEIVVTAIEHAMLDKIHTSSDLGLGPNYLRYVYLLAPIHGLNKENIGNVLAELKNKGHIYDYSNHAEGFIVKA